MSDTADNTFEPERFAVLFERFLHSYSRLIPEESNEFIERVTAHLGQDPTRLQSIAESLAIPEHPNLQLALDDLALAGAWQVIGLPTELAAYHGFSLLGVLTGRGHGQRATPSPVAFVNVAVSATETMPCVQLAVYLGTFEDRPFVLMVRLNREHGPQASLTIEIVSEERDHSARFLRQLRREMHARDVYRGKILSFTFNQFGGFGLSFHPLPHLTRDDLILPEADLDAIERHTMGVSAKAAAMRAGGRHLKRGLLLYGPPGTGKTLSIMYLCSQMNDRTTLLLSGPASHALGQAVAIARALQPSMVVLEDVDLVATERTMPGMGSNPLLFQLLNEMDGLDSDADVIFVLTTNRVELLEPALAARPGRIDQAVDIKLPDSDCRTRLFELYLRGLDHDAATLDTLVAATEGASAAFIRELVRRAALAAADEGDTEAPHVTRGHLDEALADLLTHSAPITRAILGAGAGVRE